MRVAEWIHDTCRKAEIEFGAKPVTIALPHALFERMLREEWPGEAWGMPEWIMLDGVRVQRVYLPRVEIVPAPGDACGNTKRLPDGSRCPGCRACA